MTGVLPGPCEGLPVERSVDSVKPDKSHVNEPLEMELSAEPVPAGGRVVRVFSFGEELMMFGGRIDVEEGVMTVVT